MASEIDYQDEVLSDFDALRHQEDVDNFIEGDKFHLSGTAQRVMDLIGISTVAKQNEYPQKDQIVKQEMNKKTRYKPLRKLMDEASEVISAAKPCWMMSPLLVSQILPQKRVFDLVIFDEASQIKPEDAIGAIGRGRQLVVAGDHLQLPPQISSIPIRVAKKRKIVMMHCLKDTNQSLTSVAHCFQKECSNGTTGREMRDSFPCQMNIFIIIR